MSNLCGLDKLYCQSTFFGLYLRDPATIVVWGGFLYGSNRRTAVPIQLTCEEPMARWRTVLYIVSETSFMMSADLRPCETRGHHFLKMGPRLRRGAPVFHTGSIALSAFNNI